MPQDINPCLGRPPLSRDPYNAPLSPKPPKFMTTSKITQERCALINFGPPGWLSEEERSLLMSVIVLREKAIAFSAEDRGLLKHSYGKPYKIPVIPHTTWQKKPIPIPNPIKPQFIEFVREMIRTGLYEQSTCSYTSPVFCVSKSNGKLIIVYDSQDLDKVTIKDSGLPPHIEEFVDGFSGIACYGLSDIMGGYNERELEISTRPATTF
ncbi:hypothetical protein O181_074990 [Austropuccinia psidii MF-1]|uniref:Reverse transcriptase/retrotransposon-derived protein RNase H-like domain-containing protein n=1 Tax=Austropuccinia psidii MF-1 TaxID=1389203 RepID=A0A9Q3F5P7_9BASI|nr:hypothetical protein [Austropuccinia psidii MF-1]